MIISKMTNFWKYNLAIFDDVKKLGIYFSYNTFAFRFAEKENFFQENIMIELKTFFIIF